MMEDIDAAHLLWRVDNHEVDWDQWFAKEGWGPSAVARARRSGARYVMRTVFGDPVPEAFRPSYQFRTRIRT